MSGNLIIRAAQFAAMAHCTQKRKYTGRPYIEHPMRVAGRVSMIPSVNEQVVAAAWLHDVLEDCPAQVTTCHAEFSGTPLVLSIVKELTNPSKEFPQFPRAQRKAMDREHIAQASDWAKIVKLIDRVDNLREMIGASPDFREKYSNESQQLAEAIGTSDCQREGLIHGLCREVVNEAKRLSAPTPERTLPNGP